MSKSPLEDTVTKVSNFARALDAVLVVVFAALVVQNVMLQSWTWALGFAACALFCAYTAATGPLDRVFSGVRSRFLGQTKVPMGGVGENNLNLSRQARRKEARAKARSKG